LELARILSAGPTLRSHLPQVSSSPGVRPDPPPPPPRAAPCSRGGSPGWTTVGANPWTPNCAVLAPLGPRGSPCPPPAVFSFLPRTLIFYYFHFLSSLTVPCSCSYEAMYAENFLRNQGPVVHRLPPPGPSRWSNPKWHTGYKRCIMGRLRELGGARDESLKCQTVISESHRRSAGRPRDPSLVPQRTDETGNPQTPETRTLPTPPHAPSTERPKKRRVSRRGPRPAASAARGPGLA